MTVSWPARNLRKSPASTLPTPARNRSAAVNSSKNHFGNFISLSSACRRLRDSVPRSGSAGGMIVPRDSSRAGGGRNTDLSPSAVALDEHADVVTADLPRRRVPPAVRAEGIDEAHFSAARAFVADPVGQAPGVQEVTCPGGVQPLRREVCEPTFAQVALAPFHAEGVHPLVHAAAGTHALMGEIGGERPQLGLRRTLKFLRIRVQQAGGLQRRVPRQRSK